MASVSTFAQDRPWRLLDLSSELLFEFTLAETSTVRGLRGLFLNTRNAKEPAGRENLSMKASMTPVTMRSHSGWPLIRCKDTRPKNHQFLSLLFRPMSSASFVEAIKLAVWDANIRIGQHATSEISLSDV